MKFKNWKNSYNLGLSVQRNCWENEWCTICEESKWSEKIKWLIESGDRNFGKDIEYFVEKLAKYQISGYWPCESNNVIITRSKCYYCCYY